MSVFVWEFQPDNLQDPLFWNSGSFTTGASAEAFRPLMIRGDVGNKLIVGDGVEVQWQGPSIGTAEKVAAQSGNHADLEILGLVLIGLVVFLWYLTRRRSRRVSTGQSEAEDANIAGSA